VLFYSPIDGFKKIENVPEMQVTDLFFAEKPKDVFYFEAKNQNFKEGFSNGNKVTALGTLVFASLNINLPIDVVKINTYNYEINYQGDIQKRTLIWTKAVQAQFTGKFRLEVRNIAPPKKK
jgi:RNAse (barnase) inhibitor barstar